MRRLKVACESFHAFAADHAIDFVLAKSFFAGHCWACFFFSGLSDRFTFFQAVKSVVNIIQLRNEFFFCHVRC